MGEGREKEGNEEIGGGEGGDGWKKRSRGGGVSERVRLGHLHI